jgi:hypothetical protein
VSGETPNTYYKKEETRCDLDRIMVYPPRIHLKSNSYQILLSKTIMSSDGEIDEIIAEDRRSNPSCNYSYSNQRRCQSVNGKSVCDVLNRVMRMCPGKAPIEVYSNSIKEDSDSSAMIGGRSNGFSDHEPFPIPKHFDDPLSLFGDMLKEFARPGLPPGFPGAPRSYDGFFSHEDDDSEPRFSLPDREQRGFGLFGPPKSNPPPVKGEVSGPIERI